MTSLFHRLFLPSSPGGNISGKVELGIDSSGAEGMPGDEVVVRLRAKAGRPVNEFRCQLYFDPTLLNITEVTPIVSAVGLNDWEYLNNLGLKPISRFAFVHTRLPLQMLFSFR